MARRLLKPESYDAAVKTCLAVLDRTADVDEARVALIIAAGDANILAP